MGTRVPESLGTYFRRRRHTSLLIAIAIARAIRPLIGGPILSGSLAKLLNVPQAGGYLVKTVVKDSLAERLGAVVRACVPLGPPAGPQGKVVDLATTWSGGPEGGASPR